MGPSPWGCQRNADWGELTLSREGQEGIPLNSTPNQSREPTPHHPQTTSFPKHLLKYQKWRSKVQKRSLKKFPHKTAIFPSKKSRFSSQNSHLSTRCLHPWVCIGQSVKKWSNTVFPHKKCHLGCSKGKCPRYQFWSKKVLFEDRVWLPIIVMTPF